MKNIVSCIVISLALYSSVAFAQSTPNIPPPTTPTFPPPVNPGIEQRRDSIEYRSQFPQDSAKFRRDSLARDTVRMRVDSSRIFDDKIPKNYPDTIPR